MHEVLRVTHEVFRKLARRGRPIQFGGDEHARALTTDAALGINPLFTWAELEPSEGAFNWTPIDTALAAAHAAGRKVAPRVYTNAGDISQACGEDVVQHETDVEDSEEAPNADAGVARQEEAPAQGLQGERNEEGDDGQADEAEVGMFEDIEGGAPIDQAEQERDAPGGKNDADDETAHTLRSPLTATGATVKIDCHIARSASVPGR